jgi:hypothetical protein
MELNKKKIAINEKIIIALTDCIRISYNTITNQHLLLQ